MVGDTNSPGQKPGNSASLPAGTRDGKDVLDECSGDDLAALATESAVDSAKLPALQMRSLQASRVAFLR